MATCLLGRRSASTLSLPETRVRRQTPIWVVLVVLPLIVFWQVRGFDFVSFDDQGYTYGNLEVMAGLDGDGVRWSFTTIDEANWHPLTWLSLMLDTELHGGTARGFHLTNLALHLANGLLLFIVFLMMTGERWKSAFVAALFAIHPLHVESVAWISSRKDVLSTLFGLLALIAYVRYVRLRQVRWQIAALAAYLCSLLSKQMLVTLPFLLLLLDYWPLGRLKRRSSGTVRRLVLEKMPFLALAVASAVIVYWAQNQGGAMQSAEAFPLGVRLLNAPVAYVLYLARTIWPAGLSVFYPHPGAAISIVPAVGAAGLLAVASIVVLRQTTRRPFAFIGWFWFLGMLVPVIGLVQIGEQQMADRYTYLPIVGLFLIAAWLPSSLIPPAPWRNRLLVGTAAAALAGLAVAAWFQTGTWRDSETLFRRALAVTRNNAIVHNNLGSYLGRKGRYEAALEHLQQAVAIQPDNPDALSNLGLALSMTGRSGEAFPRFEKALAIDPELVSAHMNWGLVLTGSGRPLEALEHYRAALTIDPENAEIVGSLVSAHRSIGRGLAQGGDATGATSHFREALELQPEDAVSHYDLAAALFLQGVLDESRVHYEAALERNPDLAEARNGLGLVLLRQGDKVAAVKELRNALRIRPDFAAAQRNLKEALDR
jgi:tetratricopeptide (TPR) repeat protein